jgi:hypothetical protein
MPAIQTSIATPRSETPGKKSAALAHAAPAALAPGRSDRWVWGLSPTIASVPWFLHHVICVLHAPRAELWIELDRRQPSELAVVIEQTQCLLAGRLGLGLWHTHGNKNSSATRQDMGSHPYAELTLPRRR